jgi:hypothetical protein
MKDFLELMEAGEKLETNLKTASQRIDRFDEKLVKFVELIANKSGMPAHKRTFMMKEAETTSDFPVLFGTVLERTLLGRYQIAKPDWREYVKTGTQNDFRTSWQMKTYGLQSAMQAVKERGEYKGDKLQDGKYTISIQKYGRAFGLSWEAVINDDLGAFSDIPDRLANACLRTEHTQATNLFASSTGPNSTLFGINFAHPIDGNTITNKITGAGSNLTIANLQSIVTAMRKQYDEDGEPIMITRFHLVVPPDLEFTALQTLSNNILIATALGSTSAAAVQTNENVIAKVPITLHVNPYLPLVDTTHGTKAYYVFADPTADGPACQLNFLRGHESPELVQKMSDKVTLGGSAVSPLEGDFDSDSMIWRVRHILGGTQLDPRFAYASQGE